MVQAEQAKEDALRSQMVEGQHITRWKEQAMAMAHEPTGLYNPSAYPEYFSWYRLCTRATLLSGPLPPGHIPYPKDRTRRLHILVISLINYFYNSIHSLVTSNIFKCRRRRPRCSIRPS